VLVFNAADAGFFRKLRIPCVVINDLAPGYWNVATDHMQSIRVAVEYLLKLGHCRIGYLGAGYDAWGCNERRRGYQETVRSAGVPEIMEFYSSRGQSIDDAIGKLLTRQITGLIVEGEENGLIADHALKSRGVKIPDDLSLITFESCNTSCFIYPAHTTVMQDFDGMGKAAAQVLLKLTIQADRKTVLPETQMFSNRLIERDSCKKLTEQ
jgi:DNA-binding LacI/PurR family transcriptional regulator